MHNLRCKGNKLHGRVLDGNVLEVACRSRFCGWRSGAIVLHRFNLESGELVETLKFKQPRKER